MNTRKRKCSSLGLLYRRELLPGFAAVSTFPCFFLLAFQRERESSHASDCERRNGGGNCFGCWGRTAAVAAARRSPPASLHSFSWRFCETGFGPIGYVLNVARRIPFLTCVYIHEVSDIGPLVVAPCSLFVGGRLLILLRFGLRKKSSISQKTLFQIDR